MNTKGDMIVEYSYLQYRLFYGLNKDGSYLFSNESSNTYELNIDNDIIDNIGYFYFDPIYKTTNTFISIKNDINKDNQYLFSINSFYSIVELHNFNINISNNINHYIWSFNDFFKLKDDDSVFPIEHAFFELTKENTYIVAFIPKDVINQDILSNTFLKKFRLKTFDYDAFEELTSVKYTKYINNRILDIFLMDDIRILAVVTFEKYTHRNLNTRRLDCLNYQGWIYLKLYSNDLKLLLYDNQMILDELNICDDIQEELFLKSIYLKDGNIMFVYFSSFELYFDIYKFDYNNGVRRIQYISYYVVMIDNF